MVPPSTLLAALADAVGSSQVSSREGDLFAAGRDLWPQLTLALRDGTPWERPFAVVRPRDETSTVRALRILQEYRVPVVPFGTGSGVCGGAWAGVGTVVIDAKLLCDLGAVDAAGLFVDAGPGIVLLDLERRLNDRGFTLGHFPSSIACASLGGAVAARGAGQLSSRYGKIEDMVTGLHVATPGLGLVRTGSLDPSQATPDWTQVFVGSEGTLGVITRIRLRVHPLPSSIALGGVRFPNVRAGMAGFRRILQAGLRPSVMRLYDPLDTWMAMTKANDRGGPAPVTGAGDPLAGGARARPQDNATEPGPAPPERSATPRLFGVIIQPGTFIGSMLSGVGAAGKMLRGEGESPLIASVSRAFGLADFKSKWKPEALPMDRLLAHPRRVNAAIDLLPSRCLSVLGCEGAPDDAREQLQAAVAIARQEGAVDLGPGPGEQWFRTRYHVSFKLPKLLRGGAFADTMETAAPWTALPAVYEGVRKAVAGDVLIMAHLSHAYPEGGSLYFTMVGHGADPEATQARYARAWEHALAAVHENGGTASHHHGIGLLKRDRNGAEHGDGRRLWEAVRALVDPRRILNPGKLFPPELPAPGPVVPPAPRRDLVIHPHEDGVVEVGPDWGGAALAAELATRGHFLPPLGRDFLEGTVHSWLVGPTVAAWHRIHGAWEHPLLAGEGRLTDGRAFRSGLLPRSAAGPNWLPFLCGAELGPTVSRVTLRAGTPPAMRWVGRRYPSWESATLAMRSACRTTLRPLAGGLYPTFGSSPWRMSADRRDHDGISLFLALREPDGFPRAASSVLAVLDASGGMPLPDEDALSWWEDHWAQVAREGESALARTGPEPSPSEVGRVAAVLPWGRALALLRAVESLCGGPVRATGWMDQATEAGVTVRFRVFSSRPQEPVHALVPHQIAGTVQVHGGCVVAVRWTAVEDGPPLWVPSGSQGENTLSAGLPALLRAPQSPRSP